MLNTEQQARVWDDLAPDQRRVVGALAVLGPIDLLTLAAMLECNEDVLQATLHNLPFVVFYGGDYALAEPMQKQAHTALAADPEQGHEWHQRAIEVYAAALHTSTIVEERYMHHLATRCEQLMRQQPTALAAEVAHVSLHLLREPRHRQLVQLYRAGGEGLCDRFEPAISDLENLLAQADLDDHLRGRALNALALFAQGQGDYERARRAYEQSEIVGQRLGNLLQQGHARNNRGILHYELQEYAEAEACFDAAARLFGLAEADYQQGMAYNGLGLLYRDQGRWDAALHYFERAAASFACEGASDFCGRVANNIGEVQMLCGAYAEADRSFEQALQQMTTRIYTVDVWINRGLMQQAQNDHAAAIRFYTTALELAHAIDRQAILPLIQYRLGHAAQQLGQIDVALTHYATAMTIIEEQREPLRDQGLLIGLMGRWQQVYDALVMVCVQRGDAAAAFAYAERARARALADLLGRRHTLEAITPLATVAVQAALSPRMVLLAYVAVGLRGPENDLLRAMPPAAAGLRDALHTPPALVRFVVDAEHVAVDVCGIDPNVLQPTTSYQADGRRFLQPAILQRLYTALIAPVARQLAAADLVCVIPHGPLHHLPFAALLDAGQQPLLNTMCCIYAPSATVLLATKHQPPSAAAPCLALGYDGDSDHALRHTEQEAANVAQLTGGDVWLPRPDRLRQFIDRAADYRWLHIACHGEFDLDEPLQSWLAIAPDQRLTAADVIDQLHVRAELVTLSACRSGVSHVLRGDEPMGLVRAFLSAGAHKVLVTLWPVEDESARLLMEHFYTTLTHSTQPDVAAALCAAQQYLRHLTINGIQPYADPLFWAAYVLVSSTL